MTAVLPGQWAICLNRGELGEAERYATEIYQLGEAQNDVMWKCFGSGHSGIVCGWLGKFINARAHFEHYLSLWEPMYRASWPLPHDLYVACLLDFSRTLLCLGYVDQARLRRSEALVEVRRRSPFTLSFALCLAWFGDWALEGVTSAPTMLQSVEDALSMSDKHGFADVLFAGKVMRGWCLGAMGRATEGIPWLLEGIAICRATGTNLVLPFFLMRLAEVYGIAAQPEEGFARLAEAAELVEMTQGRWDEAELHRLRGTLLQ